MYRQSLTMLSRSAAVRVAHSSGSISAPQTVGLMRDVAALSLCNYVPRSPVNCSGARFLATHSPDGDMFGNKTQGSFGGDDVLQVRAKKTALVGGKNIYDRESMNADAFGSGMDDFEKDFGNIPAKVLAARKRREIRAVEPDWKAQVAAVTPDATVVADDETNFYRDPTPHEMQTACIWEACRRGWVMVALHRLNEGGPIFLNIPNTDGATPIYCAVQHKHEKLSMGLLVAGADVTMTPPGAPSIKELTKDWDAESQFRKIVHGELPMPAAKDKAADAKASGNNGNAKANNGNNGRKNNNNKSRNRK